MQQQTILTCPAQLFRVRPETNELIDRGRCVCALVGLPAQPPKYSLVCYNSKQELLCVGRLATSNEASLQFRVDSTRTGYASFRDDLLDTWTLLVAKPELLVRLLAELGAAFYVLNGRRADRPVCALRSFADTSAEGLTVGVHEALVQYTAFALTASSAQSTAPSAISWLPTCERVVESTVSPAELFSPTASTAVPLLNGTDESAEEATPRTGPYRFFPVASMHSLPPSYRGFESSLNGLTEEGYAVVVVHAASRASPQTDASPLTPLSTVDVVFVVRVLHMRHRDVRVTIKGSEGLPPAVFAETESRAMVVSSPSLSSAPFELRPHDALALVPFGPQSSAFGSSDNSSAAAVGGPGIPLAHMTLIQKIGAGVQTAIVTTRDVRDIAAQAEETWTYAVNRPKPSALSNTALVEQVQALVHAADARAAEMARYDDLVNTMERKNSEAQRQIEELSRRCDAALKSRSTVEATAVDANLERRRLLLRLKEELSRSTEEREDTRRHLDGARKLLQTSTDVLRVERGKLDIQRVQQQSLDGRLAAALELSSVERARRHALEAKATEVQSELRRTQAERRLIADRLHTLHTKADGERDRYAALMEDERHRISADALELRQNAVAELQRQDTQHRAAQAQLQQEHHQRGYREGKDIGREASTMDLSVHRKELALEVQRASESLASRKQELQRALEAALAVRRTNEAGLHEVKHQLAEALERRAQLEMQVARASTASEGVSSDLSSPQSAAHMQEGIVARLQGLLMNVSVPLPPSLLYHVVELAQHGEDALPVSTVTQMRDLEESYVRESLMRRAGWVEEELFSIYTKGEAVYYQEWLHALQPAHAALRLTMQTLIGQQRGGLAVALYEVWLMETDARQAVEASRADFMASLVAQQAAQAEQRAKLLREATTALRATFNGYERGLRAIHLLRESQIRAQTQLALEETETRQTLEREAEVASRALPQMCADLQLGRHVAAQGLVLASEEAARAALLTDECTAFSSLTFKYASEAEEAARTAQQRERTSACTAEEVRARADILRDEDAAREALHGGWREAQGLPTPLTVPPPVPPVVTAHIPPPPPAVPAAVPEAVPAVVPAVATTTATSSASPAQVTPPVPPPTAAPAPIPLPSMPVPTPAAAAAAPPAPPAPPATHTFIDDDDAFDRAWLAPPPVVAPSVPPPLPPDDSDTETTVTMPPRAAAQTVAPPTPAPPTDSTVPAARSPETPPRSSTAAAASLSKASPVAGLALVEQQWRTQRPRNVLDDLDDLDDFTAPANTVAQPAPVTTTATVKPSPVQETRAPPPAPPPAPASAPTTAPSRRAVPSSPSTSSSSSADDDSDASPPPPPPPPRQPIPERVQPREGTHSAQPTVPQASHTTAPRGPSREASKAAIAAQAAAARAEKMKLFESSDSDEE